MKQRNGFVSNSSSCSFTIDCTNLSGLQVLAIFQHMEVAKKLGDYEEEEDQLYYDGWQVVARGQFLDCAANMDNFELYSFVKKLGVPEEAISNFDHSNGGSYEDYINQKAWNG